MAIRFRCPSCRQLLSIATRKAGQTVRCPGCQTEIEVPETEELTPAAAVSETAPAEDRAATDGIAAAEPPPVLEPAEECRESSVAAEDDEEEFALRSPDTEFEDMDLTPMVDVTFLLLIFFMITAAFSVEKTIQIPAPDPDEEGVTQTMTLQDLETSSIIVEIDEKNVIMVDDVPIADPRELVDKLLERMRMEHKAELVIKAHESAFHETVVLVVDAASEVGMQKIRLATRGEG